MNRLLIAALAVLSLTGCRTQSEALQLSPGSAWNHSLDDVDSICDQHGNRLYWYGGSNFAVVGQDPTCKAGGR